MQGEKRNAPRKALKYPAKLDFGDGSPPRNCVLADVSATGARIMLEENSDLPKVVRLILGRGNAHRFCKIAWRDGPEYGLEFVKGAPTSAPRLRAAQARAIYEV